MYAELDSTIKMEFVWKIVALMKYKIKEVDNVNVLKGMGEILLDIVKNYVGKKKYIMKIPNYVIVKTGMNANK